MEGGVETYRILRAFRATATSLSEIEDPVAVEQPVKALIGGAQHTLYALPQAIEELVAGYAYTESLLKPPFWVKGAVASPTPIPRGRLVHAPGPAEPPHLSPQLLSTAMDELLSSGTLHFKTGATHLAGALAAGGLKYTFEDVSRHRAVDKVVGALLLSGETPRAYALLVSSRITYTLARKAAAAGFAAMASRAAVTTAAVEEARRAGMCLIGFVRGGRLNIYVPCPSIAGTSPAATASEEKSEKAAT